MKKRPNPNRFVWKKKQGYQKKSFKKMSRKSKQLLLAICSALFIGTIFGLITLQMSKQTDEQRAEILHSSTADEDGTSSKKIDSFDVYVVQGGVFREETNAKQWESKFENLQFPAHTWKRKGDYYLFAGIGSSTESVEKFAEAMQEQGLDVYVKEWKIAEVKIEGTNADHRWLVSFVDQFKKSLDSTQNGNGLLVEEWIALTEEKNELSDRIQGFNDTIFQHMSEISDDKEQQLLLQLLYDYEQITE